MPQRGAHEQHPQHGGEGKAPHRAEAFVAMKRKEDTSQSATTRHAKGMTTGPDQKAPEDNQGGREGGGSRRERAKPQAPKPPDQTKKGDSNTTKTTEQQQRKGGAPQHQGRNHTRSVQATANQNRDIQGRQEMHGREVQTQTDHTKHCTKELGRMSIPAQSADKHTHTQSPNLKLRL